MLCLLDNSHSFFLFQALGEKQTPTVSLTLINVFLDAVLNLGLKTLCSVVWASRKLKLLLKSKPVHTRYNRLLFFFKNLDFEEKTVLYIIEEESPHELAITNSLAIKFTGLGVLNQWTTRVFRIGFSV